VRRERKTWGKVGNSLLLISLFLPLCAHQHKQKRFTNTNNRDFFLLLVYVSTLFMVLRNFYRLIEMFFYLSINRWEKNLQIALFQDVCQVKRFECGRPQKVHTAHNAAPQLSCRQSKSSKKFQLFESNE
jgi:hypothetical protein